MTLPTPEMIEAARDAMDRVDMDIIAEAVAASRRFVVTGVETGTITVSNDWETFKAYNRADVEMTRLSNPFKVGPNRHARRKAWAQERRKWK